LSGHSNTVESILCQADEPQIITGSHDKMIKFWDIRKQECLHTLTQHKKGVRAMVLHPSEYTFASGGSDKIRVWKFPEGHQLRAINGPAAIVNSLALNADNVLVSGADDGTLSFYDWQSGHCF
jgi:pleiotropic regulator 1